MQEHRVYGVEEMTTMSSETERVSRPAGNGARILASYHTGVTVRDLDRSLRFYRDVLGFEVVFEWTSGAGYIGELLGAAGATVDVRHLRVPGSEHQVELVEYRGVDRTRTSGRPRDSGQGHIAFWVSGLDDLLARVHAIGLRALSAPVTSTRAGNEGTRVVYVEDPDGFWVELLERAADR